MCDGGPERLRRVQWELVALEHADGELVLDVIEVAQHPWSSTDQLMSVALVPAELGREDLEELTEILSGWVQSDALCDVIHAGRPGGGLALLQDDRLLVLLAP